MVTLPLQWHVRKVFASFTFKIPKTFHLKTFELPTFQYKRGKFENKIKKYLTVFPLKICSFLVVIHSGGLMLTKETTTLGVLSKRCS